MDRAQHFAGQQHLGDVLQRHLWAHLDQDCKRVMRTLCKAILQQADQSTTALNSAVAGLRLTEPIAWEARLPRLCRRMPLLRALRLGWPDAVTAVFRDCLDGAPSCCPRLDTLVINVSMVSACAG